MKSFNANNEHVRNIIFFQVPKLYKNGVLDTNGRETTATYIKTINANPRDVFRVKIHSTEAKYNGPFSDSGVKVPPWYRHKKTYEFVDTLTFKIEHSFVNHELDWWCC